ncbi:MAG: 2,3-bisphosphoglycerate-independent phosphoglycerate mutase [Flavobacteriales bacterium]
MSNKKVALLILDGWGTGNEQASDAVFQANTPKFDKLKKIGSSCALRTDGRHVGLPEGQMGNSEVGHLNIGAGRVIFQDLVRINTCIETNSLKDNLAVKSIIKKLKAQPNKRLHLMGLVSDGGIHAHIDHLLALIDVFSSVSNQIFIHAFTDGRDTDPKSGLGHLTRLSDYISPYSNIHLASLIGRYFAMDRDHRWARVAKAYHLLTAGKGQAFDSAEEALKSSYDQGITDEFIEPTTLNTKQDSQLKANDIVLCFNYRTDRCREISMALSQVPIQEQNLHPIDIEYVTMTTYDEQFKNVEVLFEKDNLKNTLGEVLSAAGKTQVRIAETEKYPHVTFFFSGGREKTFEGETRLLIPSPKVATYDLAPEMSANEITEACQAHINSDQASDFICLNFANPDMVGHTGQFDAVVKAVETVDGCLDRLVPNLEEEGYQILIIADHGNAEKMKNEDGSIHTAHTTNKVPCLLLNSDRALKLDGKLADIAPTILELMDLNQVEEMDGRILV